MTEIRKSSIALLLFITACTSTPVPTDVNKPEESKTNTETSIKSNRRKKFEKV